MTINTAIKIMVLIILALVAILIVEKGFDEGCYRPCFEVEMLECNEEACTQEPTNECYRCFKTASEFCQMRCGSEE